MGPGRGVLAESLLLAVPPPLCARSPGGAHPRAALGFPDAPAREGCLGPAARLPSREVRTERTNRREYRLFRVARAVGRTAPFWLLQRLGALLGVAFLLVSSRRRTVFGNLKRVLRRHSRYARMRIALRCAAHFGRISFDFIKWSQAAPGTFDRMVRCEGLDNLREALARGKGCFVLSAHFGHWEVAAQWLAVHGFPQSLVYRPLENPLVEAELAAARTRFGSSLIPKGSATRGIVKTLRGGGIVDILIDQKADLEHSVIVDFLGIPTPTTPSLARVALATGATVVPLFSYPRGTGYEFTLEPAILAEPGDTVTTLTQRYNLSVSRRILERPHLWFWFHDRWTPRKRRTMAG
jgi:Kdo2-lipid IVA lauroyltransferase/acyltransferase